MKQEAQPLFNTRELITDPVQLAKLDRLERAIFDSLEKTKMLNEDDIG